MCLEAVYDLSLAAFIASLKPFFARLGISSEGASRALNKYAYILFADDNKIAIANECSTRGVSFHFIPPRSAHFRGLLESLIKVAKKLLAIHLNNASLTYEELTTAVAQIETVMNSTPLCSIASDPNDFEALTPGHFLIGKPMNSFPETFNEDELNIGCLNRWKRIQAVQQSF